MDLHIALKSKREGALVDALLKERVAEIVAPRPDTFEFVNSWVKQHGVPSSMISMTHGGSWLTVGGVRVSQDNDLLGTSYRHPAANSTVPRTIGYGFPAELHAH
ncbi:hypothetical protein EDB85DRAFT_2183542 [Lactarius pseudohatsudake]|nr:hypothetical protein EDB85DRAFT_2183542 [Lactarius pseudohatsudake]